MGGKTHKDFATCKNLDEIVNAVFLGNPTINKAEIENQVRSGAIRVTIRSPTMASAQRSHVCQWEWFQHIFEGNGGVKAQNVLLVTKLCVLRGHHYFCTRFRCCVWIHCFGPRVRSPVEVDVTTGLCSLNALEQILAQPRGQPAVCRAP